MPTGHVPDARMLSPEFVNAIASLSSSALFVIAIVALVTGRVRRESEFKDAKAEDAAARAELRVDRDEWKTIANNSLAKLDRLTDVVETLTGKSRA